MNCRSLEAERFATKLINAECTYTMCVKNVHQFLVYWYLSPMEISR